MCPGAVRALAVFAGLLLFADDGLPSTVAVPGPYPTIQAAIDGVPSGTVIQLAPGTYHERLTLQSITRALTLRGDATNPGAFVIDGGGAGDTVRILSCGTNVVFEGVTITGGARGNDGYGGGVFMADSSVIFHDCVFTGNAADLDGGGAFILRSGGLFEGCSFHGNRAGRFGGGAMVNVGGTTVFERCLFVGNEAGVTDGVNGWGGGVHVNDSSPSFVGCVIRGNRSKFAAGGISLTGHFTAPESTVMLRDCTIADNTSVRANASSPPAEGGGMHVEDNVRVLLERCHVHGNVSNRGGGLNDYRARYEITDSVIEDNRADVVDGQGGTGGGIYAQSVTVGSPGRAAEVVVSDAVIRRNVADVGGGVYIQGDFSGLTANQARLDVSDSLIAENVANGRAGAILADRTVATIRRSQILSNQVTAPTNSWGGGLGSVAGSNTTIDQSTVAGNMAVGVGGAIYVDQGGQLTVTGSRFTANRAGSAPLGGGAIAVGQQPGPIPGPATGLVVTTAFADDGPGAEIWESNCDLSHYSTIAYRNNAVQSTAGGVYFRNCTGATPTVAAFNQLAGKASGNVDAAGNFMSFAAIPSVILSGDVSVLAWCAPNASGLGITGGVGPVGGPCGTQDVTPANTTTYVLSATSTAATSPATVTIGCAAAGTPLPVSPANGDSQRPPGTVMLGWYPAAGATSYDVYLDTSAQPRTLVAADVVGTSAAVAGLGPGVQYRWRVVAKSTGCTETSAGPLSAFTTCANATCEFVATFDDDDLSGWTRVGKGVANVFGGSLHLATRRHLTVVPPAPATGDGSLSLALALESGRREVRLLLGYRDPRTYSELAIRGAAGRVTLSTRAGRHRRRLAVVKRAFPTASVFTVQLVIAGANLTLLVEGTPAMTAALARPSFGTFAIQAVASTVAIDDVRIRAN